MTVGTGRGEIPKNVCMSTVLIRMLCASSLNVRLFLGAMAVRKAGTDPYRCTRLAYLPQVIRTCHIDDSWIGRDVRPLSSPVRSLDSVCPQDFAESPVAVHVAKATSDFDLKCTRTPADLSCMLGQRCREALRNNPQYSLDTGHKMFGSSKYVRLLPLLFPTTFHRPLMLFHQSAARHC